MTDIKGYTKPTEEMIEAVNENKVFEERVLRQLEERHPLEPPPVDARMLALARTKIREALAQSSARNP